MRVLMELSSLCLIIQAPKSTMASAVGFDNPEYRTPAILAFVERLIIPAGIPTTVIAGLDDEIIPIDAIRALVSRSPDPAAIDYIEVQDKHRLHCPEALAAMRKGIARMLDQT